MCVGERVGEIEIERGVCVREREIQTERFTHTNKTYPSSFSARTRSSSAGMHLVYSARSRRYPKRVSASYLPLQII